jgi:hypothetical protein
MLGWGTILLLIVIIVLILAYLGLVSNKKINE